MVYVLADPALRDLLHRRPRTLSLPTGHAPIASGGSNSCRVGYLPPTGSTCPFHGARFLRASLGWSSHARNPSHQRICRPKDPRIEDRITVIYTSEKMALRFRRRPRFILVEYPSKKRTGCACGCGCFLVPCLLFFLFLLHCAEWL